MRGEGLGCLGEFAHESLQTNTGGRWIVAVLHLPGRAARQPFGGFPDRLIGHGEQEIELLDRKLRLAEALGKDRRELFSRLRIVWIELEPLDQAIGLGRCVARVACR